MSAHARPEQYTVRDPHLAPSCAPPHPPTCAPTHHPAPHPAHQFIPTEQVLVANPRHDRFELYASCAAFSLFQEPFRAALQPAAGVSGLGWSAAVAGLYVA